jgi:hypothetical protein
MQQISPHAGRVTGIELHIPSEELDKRHGFLTKRLDYLRDAIVQYGYAHSNLLIFIIKFRNYGLAKFKSR